MTLVVCSLQELQGVALPLNHMCNVLQEMEPNEVALEYACELVDARMAFRNKHASRSSVNDQSHTPSVSDDAVDSGNVNGSGKAELQRKKAKQSQAADEASEDKRKQTSSKASKLGVKGQKQSRGTKSAKGSAETSSEAPKSGYRLFWKQQWEKLRKDDPSIKMTDATTRISLGWKQLDAAAKRQYN